MKTQTVLFPVLPGMNEIVAAAKRRGAHGWSGYSQMKKAWQDRLIGEIKVQKLHKVKTYPVQLHYEWREPNKRRDPSNVAAGGRKFCEDSLVVAGILLDDRWAQIAGWTDTFVVNATHPGVLVTIIEP